jgi:hypothetical protein
VQAPGLTKEPQGLFYTLESDFKPLNSIPVPTQQTYKHSSIVSPPKAPVMNERDDDFYNPLFDVEASFTRETPQYGNTMTVTTSGSISSHKKEAKEMSQPPLDPDGEFGDSFGRKSSFVDHRRKEEDQVTKDQYPMNFEGIGPIN